MRRKERARFDAMALVEWQTRQLAFFTSHGIGGSEELAAAAQQISVTGRGEDVPPAAVPPRTGREEWEAAAEADQQRREDAGEMVGVPAGGATPIAELPEMTGVPAGGPKQQAAGTEVRGAGAATGSAEGLINALQFGQPRR